MIRIDTANRLQGAEFDVTIVLRPLSGRRDATAFHLEADRLCVLASRHRHACIVVARTRIADLLDAHPSDEPIHLGVRASFPTGGKPTTHCSLTSPTTAYQREISAHSLPLASQYPKTGRIIPGRAGRGRNVGAGRYLRLMRGDALPSVKGF